MKYGLIGEKLGHSFSKEIHGMIADYDYRLKELRQHEVASFLRDRSFEAINVTIPYKLAVIPFLDFLDNDARLIGAVNTIVNKGGKLYGYNTDFFGLGALAKHAGIDFKGKKVVILGTGGTSKTASAVAAANGCKSVLKVSRNKSDGNISYDELYQFHTDADILINTTPVGMYPNIDNSPIDISKFSNLCGVLDAIYNPISSSLVLDAKSRGIAAEGGLYMLVAQAVRASEIFLDTKYDDCLLESVFKKVLSDKSSIVLIGMPSSGKSTVGKIIAEKLKKEFIDTDTLIELYAKKPISKIFEDDGEDAFRDIEQRVIREASAKTGAVIATGGGAILRKENIKELRKNGTVFFLDRPLELLIPTADRPLSSSKEDVEKRFTERYEKYLAAADVRIDAADDQAAVAEKIINTF